jgi:chemotaxis protein methyltransferase WspC
VALTEVENLLSTRLGFDIQSVGPQAIDSVLRKSMEEAGFSDPLEFARELSGDPDTWNQLVDNVVIPETWFFRDIAPFELAAHLAHEHVGRASGRVLRVLSCPCSTGEEPYSLVMALLHAGAQPEAFTVDAVDVSRRALESAHAGAYRARSFRENALWFRAQYFDHTEGAGIWKLKSDVASLVKFRHANLMSPDFLEDDAPYDLVFCRNLLIYLHAEARLVALTALRRLVADHGVLVLGHAEAGFAREHGFTPTGPPAAFAFTRIGGRQVSKVRPGSRDSVASNVAPRSSSGAPRSVTITSIEPVTAAVDSTPESEPSALIVARRLGDAGQIDEAIRICSEYLQDVPGSADGYFLLGVLHDALGRSDLAEGLFRKVLYLDPNHREGLLHLALKKEARGDASGAALLRARALRCEDVSTSE